jgi:hypothetical protein
MQIENDYDKEVYNGDIGYIDNVDPDAGEIIASFDGRAVTYGFGELNMLVPAYAATIHKSQGSEYPAASSRCSRSNTPCYNAPCSTPASPAANGCRAGWPKESHRHSGAQRFRPAAMVEAGGMAGRGCCEASTGILLGLRYYLLGSGTIGQRRSPRDVGGR